MATSAEELTECIVCFEVFSDPQLLPCQHTFCKGCVNRIANGSGKISCPKCQEVHVMNDVRPDFRLNTFLDILAKQAEDLTTTVPTPTKRRKSVTTVKKCDVCGTNTAENWCFNCVKSLCRRCMAAHVMNVKTKSHRYCTLAARIEDVKADLVLDKQRIDAAISNWHERVSALQQQQQEINDLLATDNVKAVLDHGARATCRLKLCDTVRLTACPHSVCEQCCYKNIEQRITCSVCGKESEPLKGPQPENGTMRVSMQSKILLKFFFHDGIQTDWHPRPGHPYTGTELVLWLKNDAEGREILELVKEAFDARVLFTVRRVTPGGREYRVVENDIGLPEHGPMFYSWVWKPHDIREQLASKGIR